jgi:hypothetical protein
MGFKFNPFTGLLDLDEDTGATDHGALGGLADDDHAQYLKEKASGGAASEIPVHTHASAGEAGTVAHADLTGVTADQHHAQSHAHSSHAGIGADDHHNQAHALGGADHTGTLSHDVLAGVSVDDHHARDHSIIGAEHTAFPGGTTQFLRADGSFAVPAGGGGAADEPVVSSWMGI